mgnify:CR=1 FL=1
MSRPRWRRSLEIAACSAETRRGRTLIELLVVSSIVGGLVALLLPTLQAAGINTFHIYTLNRADLTLGICRRMGLKPAKLVGVMAPLSEATPPVQRDPDFR